MADDIVRELVVLTAADVCAMALTAVEREGYAAGRRDALAILGIHESHPSWGRGRICFDLLAAALWQQFSWICDEKTPLVLVNAGQARIDRWLTELLSLEQVAI